MALDLDEETKKEKKIAQYSKTINESFPRRRMLTFSRINNDLRDDE